MLSPKNSNWFGILIIIILTIILYWQFFFLGKIPMPGDTLIGAYFPWLDYKWGFPVGVPVKNALISDVFSQFFLWKYLVVDIFKSGQLPFWNIYSLSGTPVLSTYHSSVFQPFNILLFLPKFYGWGFFILSQTLCAMVGMFLLLKEKVSNFWARIFGSFIFALSGLMTTWTEFGTGVWAASMLPWIFLFLENYFSSKKIRFLFYMSISFIVLYLSGHAQLTLYSTVMAFIYLLVRYWKNKNLKLILWPVCFVILAIIFCSFQFLPTYEFTKESIRAGEAYSTSFNYGLNPIYELLKLFSADFFGNPSTNNYWDSQSYHEQSMFLGTIPFILVLSLLIFNLKSKKIDFWTGVFFTSLILGFENPLTKVIYSLPLPFITYSSAARIFFLTSFSGAILASIALDNLTKTEFIKLLKKVNFYFLGSLMGIFAGFIMVVIYLKRYEELPRIIQALANYQVTIKNLSLPIIITFLSLISIVIIKIKPSLTRYLIIFFLVITFADLSRYFYKYNPFVAQDLVFPQTPITEFLQKQPGLFRIARLDREIMPPNTWMFYKLQSIEGYDPLLSENYGRFFNLVDNQHYDNTLSRYRELDNFNPEYLNALNVKYLLSVKRDAKGSTKGDLQNPKIDKFGYKIVFEDNNTVISENPKSQERAYFVSDLKIPANKQELIDIISSSDFDPTTDALTLVNPGVSRLTGVGDVEITEYTSSKIEFKTKTNTDEFLIFADTFNKGWKLWINNSPSKIYEVNLALRGIVVPKGENSFVMVYAPDSFRYGIYLSIGAILAFTVILFYSLRRKTI